MIFSELYSAYYNTVASIISSILEGESSEKELQRIVSERAFGESVLSVMPALKGAKWQLLRKDMTTPIEHKPHMPLTTLQKQWLKAVAMDPRVKLFDVKMPEIEGVEPLFTAEDYRIYDQYCDGDPFEDKEYIRQFRVILRAIRNGDQIRFEMTSRNGKTMFIRCHPVRLEYSVKDDKFRLVTAGWRSVSTVNLAKIRSCVRYSGERMLEGEEREKAYDTVTVKITDERNALERFMLHFAHFEKQAEKTGKNTYSVRIKYVRDDETEMLIRILSFGPLAEVTEPMQFRELVKEKLKKQKSCGLR